MYRQVTEEKGVIASTLGGQCVTVIEMAGTEDAAAILL